MAKNILYAVIAVVLIAGIWYWYQTHSDTLALDGGGVSSHDTLGSNSKSNMDRGVVESRDLDGKPASSDGYGGKVTYDAPPAAPKSEAAGSASPQAVQVAPQVMPGSSSSNPAALPVSDTLTPSAPNGMAFGGSGKFQWYRQGNLTWRINTQSGAACVAFATMDEWQKEIVYTHGCGNV